MLLQQTVFNLVPAVPSENWVQRKAMGMIRRLEQLSPDERLRGLGLFSLERTRLWQEVLLCKESLEERWRKTSYQDL